MTIDGIYLDYAATTPVDGQAFDEALPYYKEVFYNPSSAHAFGNAASVALEHARIRVAKAVNAEPDEIYFNSGGTEGVNQALLGSQAFVGGKNRLIVSAIEHDSVRACADVLRSRGVTVDTVMPNRGGIITPEALKDCITDKAAMVAVMTVNNQTGAVQPIKELADIAHEHGALFFTDAVQAVNTVGIDVKQTDADIVCASGHKFYAPKGVGFFYAKRGVKFNAMIVGGGQERGLRAGTQNVPAIVALAAAIEKANNIRAEYNANVHAVRHAFLSNLKLGKPVDVENGTDDIVSVVFDGVNGGRLAVALSMRGVCCSVGSACSAGSATPPPTLIAMGVNNADCAIRFSFGRDTDIEKAIRAAQIVNDTVESLL
ncbi:MAG: cysteine desulfurase [Clostridiales bacterium]|nr:cysteine desulfurase [Clostridiales bacterium]